MNELEQLILDNVEPVPEAGCWLWTGDCDANGYGKSLAGRMISNVSLGSAHRLSYFVFKGEIPLRMYVCHICDTPACVNPAHLYVGTAQDNARDRVARMRGNFSLTKAQVLEIRSCDRSAKELAQEYGVTEKIVVNARHGITYKMVTPY